jgi:hypothetical protein
MSSLVVGPLGNVTVTVPAAGSIAVFTKGSTQVSQIVGYPNHPDTLSLLGTVTNGQTVFGPYASGAQIRIDCGALPTAYEVGAAPLVEDVLAWQIQNAPVALDATGALTAAAVLGGIVTSTTAAAVAGTVPTGTVMDAATNLQIGDSFDWSVIATGANAFTVTAAAGHTLVGTAVVATVTSGHFRTRKTAAATYVTYRIG